MFYVFANYGSLLFVMNFLLIYVYKKYSFLVKFTYHLASIHHSVSVLLLGLI